MSLPNFSSLTRRFALIFAAPMLLAAATAPALKQIAVLDIPGRPGFDEIALAHGMILISHGAAGTVDLFDPQKRRIVGHIREMSSPRGVAVDEPGHLVYIANSGARNIVVVSTNDWQVKRTIPVEAAPDALFLLPAEHLLYVSFPDSQSVAALDLTAQSAANSNAQSSNVSSQPASIAANSAVSPAGSTTASSGADGEPDSAIGRQAVSSVRVEGRPSAFAYDPSRRQLFVTLQDRRSVLVLSPQLKTVARFNLNGTEPTGIAFSPSHDRLYVAVRYAVLALDPSTGQELSRSAVAGGIDQLLLDEPTGSLLGVSNGSVFILPASGSLGPASELPVDVKGHTLAYDSATGYLFLPGGREGHSKLLILKRVLSKPPS